MPARLATLLAIHLMIMRLDVRDASNGESHLVEINADSDATVSSLLSALPVQVGSRTCYADGELLEPNVTIGMSPLVWGATLTVGEPADDPRREVRAAAGALRVIAGPDIGRVAWLTPGNHVVGRDEWTSLQLQDPDVSRRHAEVVVTSPDQVHVKDLGSTNGTLIDKKPATSTTQITPGSVVEVGNNWLEWVPRPKQPLRAARSTDGHLDFNRDFVHAPAIQRTHIELPTQPQPARNLTTLLASGAAPVVFGGVMAVASQQPTMLLFALLGPAAAAVTAMVERKQNARSQRAYRSKKEDAQAKIEATIAEQEKRSRLLAPDEVELTLAATGAGTKLWPRGGDSPDGLALRVGTSDLPAAVDVAGERWTGFEQPTLRSVPVTIDLRSIGVLGVVGTGEPTEALVRWLLIQLAVLRGPADLRLVVIAAGDDSRLSWTGWLPHLDAGEAAPFPCWVGNTRDTRAARITELKEMVAARKEQARTAGNTRFTDEVVVVLDQALALRHLPGMADILHDGPSVGVYVICVDRAGMNECRGSCEIEAAGMAVTRSQDDAAVFVRPDGMSEPAATRLARCLAPMRDRLVLGRSETAVPYPSRFLDLLGISGTPTPRDVIRLWDERPGPTTQIAIGADGSGTVRVDLAQQGPHTMLGGATGAGKSILLQTLVTSLLLANRPDELNLVLVDFKGGGAFLPFERCPHVVGLIRSTGETPADVFDEAAAKRVLASVRAEVRRRESLLARYGGEIDEYWKARNTSPSLAPLPRLVMIFDEFARVLETSPDFLKELVNVAGKGRSLGMHLVLATQSLQGKLSAELKNNIELRITLRQNEPADSTEVLGIADAATIPGRLRGRGMILCTKDENRTPHVFQSGYLGGTPPTAAVKPAQVRLFDWTTLGSIRPEEMVPTDAGETDLTLAIRAIEHAAQQLHLQAPRPPLRPPLPATAALKDLGSTATRPIPGTAVAFGLLDDPDAQEQPAAVLDLAGTDRLMVAGGSESGRTTLMRALITSLATRFRPDQAHLYVIEQQPGGLAAYAELPHCGGVFASSEPDRIRRLITWLDGEVQRRRMDRSAAGSPTRPWLLVLIDGWEHFENRSDPAFVETSLLVTLRQIITSGAAVGVHVVAAGGQDMLSGKLPNLYSRRVLLSFPKEETRRNHLTSGTISPPILPGRAVEAASGMQLQVCEVRTSAADLVSKAAQTQAANASGVLPKEFPPLPVRISLTELSLPDPPPSATWIRIGVGGDNLDTIGVDLFDAGPHLMLVSGPAGSGRTTAAATIAFGLRRVGIGIVAIAPPRSSLQRLLPDDEGVQLIRGLTIKDADLRDAASQFGDNPYAVVMDDCEQINLLPSQDGFSDAPTLLEDIVQPDALGRQALVLVGDALPILYGQRRALMRIVDEVKAGTRVLLTPTNSAAAREHGFALEADQFFAHPPGRAQFVSGRNTSLLQVALPHS